MVPYNLTYQIYSYLGDLPQGATPVKSSGQKYVIAEINGLKELTTYNIDVMTSDAVSLQSVKLKERLIVETSGM